MVTAQNFLLQLEIAVLVNCFISLHMAKTKKISLTINPIGSAFREWRSEIHVPNFSLYFLHYKETQPPFQGQC